jgi:hypothetical protein
VTKILSEVINAGGGDVSEVINARGGGFTNVVYDDTGSGKSTVDFVLDQGLAIIVFNAIIN